MDYSLDYTMLILCLVLPGIVASANTSVIPSVLYDIQPSNEITFGEDYNLTCIVKHPNPLENGTFWLKNGTKLEKQPGDTTWENDTLRVTYKIENFSTQI